MTDDSNNPIDLSALDPMSDRTSFDRRVALVAREAMDARDRLRTLARHESSGIIAALTSWARPTLLAAGVIFAIALSAVVRAAAVPSPNVSVSAADAMGLPRRLTDILHSTAQPSLTDLDVALAAAAAP
jgi:hypothetical protein